MPQKACERYIFHVIAYAYSFGCPEFEQFQFSSLLCSKCHQNCSNMAHIIFRILFGAFHDTHPCLLRIKAFDFQAFQPNLPYRLRFSISLNNAASRGESPEYRVTTPRIFPLPPNRAPIAALEKAQMVTNKRENIFIFHDQSK